MDPPYTSLRPSPHALLEAERRASILAPSGGTGSFAAPSEVKSALGEGSNRPSHWLIDRYWIFAWIILGLSSPLLLLWGHHKDIYGIGAFAVLTAGAWALSRRHAELATSTHLMLLIPYWIWYSALDGGLPQRLDGGVGEYVAMMMFPLLVLTTIARARAIILAAGMAAGGILWRWPDVDERLIGFFLISTGIVIGMAFRRLAQQYQHAESKMRHMAYHDALTGLPNRREVDDWMTTALRSERGTLFYLDLDRFKTINDVMGHGAGDLVLLEVVKRLSKLAQPNQLLARLGGDEFVLAHIDVADEDAAINQAESMLTSITEPIEVGGRVVHVGGSFGIAMWPDQGRSLDALLHAADVAMYRAKQEGGGAKLSERVSQTVVRDLKNLEVELWDATRREELRLVYQPVLALGRSEVVGAEALLRWNHHAVGDVSPAEFIPLAEETGHIVAIDIWVAAQVLSQLRVWSSAGFEGWLALNVSARSIGDPRWISEIRAMVQREPALCRRLVLEITESATMRDPDAVLAQIDELADLGLSIAIDDFGMGYSSLSYLRKIRATHLKLDRCFIAGIGEHQRDEELIELVLSLASRWDMAVVAEGVETEAQRRWLTDRGCTFGQGFGIARPMSVADIEGALIPSALRRPRAG